MSLLDDSGRPRLLLVDALAVEDMPDLAAERLLETGRLEGGVDGAEYNDRQHDQTGVLDQARAAVLVLVVVLDGVDTAGDEVHGVDVHRDHGVHFVPPGDSALVFRC